jgi:hypothetical protein
MTNMYQQQFNRLFGHKIKSGEQFNDIRYRIFEQIQSLGTTKLIGPQYLFQKLNSKTEIVINTEDLTVTTIQENKFKEQNYKLIGEKIISDGKNSFIIIEQNYVIIVCLDELGIEGKFFFNENDDEDFELDSETTELDNISMASDSVDEFTDVSETKTIQREDGINIECYLVDIEFIGAIENQLDSLALLYMLTKKTKVNPMEQIISLAVCENLEFFDELKNICSFKYFRGSSGTVGCLQMNELKFVELGRTDTVIYTITIITPTTMYLSDNVTKQKLIMKISGNCLFVNSQEGKQIYKPIAPDFN